MYAVLFQLTTTWQYLRQVKLLPARARGGRLWWIPVDLFKWLLFYNRAVTDGQRLGISPGFYEHASFVGNKSNRIKERIPGCSFQVRFWFVTQGHAMTGSVTLKNWKWVEKVLPGLLESQNWYPGLFWATELVPRLLPGPELVPQASFKSRNLFHGLFLAPGMKEKDLPKRLGTTHKRRWSTWH